MHGTIPAGSGTVFVDIIIDGGSPTRVTRTSGSSNVYDDVFYESPLLQTDSPHTIVFINRGQPTDTSFQFDRVELLNLDADPTIYSAPNLGNGTPTTQPVAGTTDSPTTSSPGSSPSSAISGGSQISSSGSTGGGSTGGGSTDGGSTSGGSTSGGRCPLFIIALIQELIPKIFRNEPWTNSNPYTSDYQRRTINVSNLHIDGSN